MEANDAKDHECTVGVIDTQSTPPPPAKQDKLVAELARAARDMMDLVENLHTENDPRACLSILMHIRSCGMMAQRITSDRTKRAELVKSKFRALPEGVKLEIDPWTLPDDATEQREILRWHHAFPEIAARGPMPDTIEPRLDEINDLWRAITNEGEVYWAMVGAERLRDCLRDAANAISSDGVMQLAHWKHEQLEARRQGRYQFTNRPDNSTDLPF